MARCTWQPNLSAPRVQQVRTLTVTSHADTETFIVTMSHPSGSVSGTVTILTVTASSQSTAQVASAIEAAFNASTNEFARQVTALASSNTVAFTADVAGVPFNIAFSGSSTGTASFASTTANVGPNDYSVAGNWLEGAVPVATSDVYIPRGGVDILYGLDQSAAAIEQFVVEGFYGLIGWPGAALKIDPDRMTFEGYGISYIDIGSAAIAPRIFNTATSGGLCNCGLYLVGSGITTLTIDDGALGLGIESNDTSTCTTIVNNGGTVIVGVDVTLTNYKQYWGKGELRNTNNMTLIYLVAGLFKELCTGTCATYTVYGGDITSYRTGNIGSTSATWYGGNADYTKSSGFAISNGNAYRACNFMRDPAMVTGTVGAPDALTGVSAPSGGGGSGSWKG